MLKYDQVILFQIQNNTSDELFQGTIFLINDKKISLIPYLQLPTVYQTQTIFSRIA
jgi:hypothetical protein